MDFVYDLIVVGRGPAGISTAVYARRAGLSVLVLGRGYGALETAHAIENYYGFEEPISGTALALRGVRQAERLGIELREEEVTSVMPGTHFEVKTPVGEYRATTLLLATGKARTASGIPGIDRLRGSGVSYCAVCDGFFYRKKRVAVVGSGDYAAEELGVLSQFAAELTLFTNGKPLTLTHPLPEGVSVVTEPITAVLGESTLSGVQAGGRDYALDGLFIALGTASAADFAAKIGMRVEDGNIVVNENFETNVQGLYAAGDCIGGFLQIAKAVSDGAQASRAIIRQVKTVKKAQTVQ